MGAFVSFMQSLAGRLLRIVVGIALIALGLLVIGNTWGIVVAVIGFVPLLAGLAGVCLVAPLFGYMVNWVKSARILRSNIGNRRET